MTIGLVAIHYPRAAHFDEFVARVQRAADAMRPTPGCLTAECWVTTARDAVVSIVQWDTEAAQASSFAAAKAAGVDFTFDEREARPREVLQLSSP